MKAIINGHCVVPNGLVYGKALLFDEKIVGWCDIYDNKVKECEEIIDANGKIVAPGLIDMHIHGYLGEDTSDCRPDGIKRMAEGVIKNGVTSFLPTTMTVAKAEILKAFDICRELKKQSLGGKDEWCGAEILGVHSEGPFINPKKKGAQAEENILACDADFIRENADIIKVITLAPEMPGALGEIERAARETKVLISMGHTGATYDEAMAGINAGVSHVTHLFNAMTPLAHRDPGVVGAALTSDVTCEMICDKFHINPVLFNMVAKLKGDKLCLITDCTRAGGLPDGEYSLGGQKTYVKGIECRLADGTIAGSVLKLNDALRNFRENSDLSLWDIVNLASLNPARALGVSDCKGSLEEGKDADIAIFDNDFTPLRTIRRGVTYFEK